MIDQPAAAVASSIPSRIFFFFSFSFNAQVAFTKSFCYLHVIELSILESAIYITVVKTNYVLVGLIFIEVENNGSPPK